MRRLSDVTSRDEHLSSVRFPLGLCAKKKDGLGAGPTVRKGYAVMLKLGVVCVVCLVIKVEDRAWKTGV